MKPERIVHWSFNEKLRTRERKVRSEADVMLDALNLLEHLQSSAVMSSILAAPAGGRSVSG